MDRPGPSLLLPSPFVSGVMGATLIFRQGSVRDGAPLPHLRSSCAGEVGCPQPPPCSAPPAPTHSLPHSFQTSRDLSHACPASAL